MSVLANTTLALTSVLISFVFMEAVYRIYLYHHIRAELVERLVAVQDSGPDQSASFDQQLGFTLSPNTTWENTAYLRNRFRINEYGLMANDIDTTPYPIEKPNNEYRIALHGDSFTFGGANYIRWADLLQDYLNRSEEWRRFVHGKFTRVLNFGLSATGVAQWGPIYEFNASRFQPDLVIVNFITDDIMRRFQTRGVLRFQSKKEMRQYIYDRITDNMSRLPWYRWRAELLAATVGKWLNMSPRLTVSAAMAADIESRFSSQDYAITQSLSSLERIRCLNRRLILLNHELLEEFLEASDGPSRWPETPELRGLLSKFVDAAQAKGFTIINLANFNLVPELTPPHGSTFSPELVLLFNLPLDTHNSDFGQFVYAKWALNYVIAWSKLPAAHTPQTAQDCH